MNKPSFPLNTERCNVRFRLSASAGEGRTAPPPAAGRPRPARCGEPAAPPRPTGGRASFPGAQDSEQSPGGGGGWAGTCPRRGSPARPRSPGAAGAAPAAPRRSASRGREQLAVGEVQRDGGSPSGPAPRCREFLT